MSTYKGTYVNKVRTVLKDGTPITDVAEWGWYGHECRLTAHLILKSEFGPTIANKFANYFCRAYLALQPESGFSITSEDLAEFILHSELLGNTYE